MKEGEGRKWSLFPLKEQQVGLKELQKRKSCCCLQKIAVAVPASSRLAALSSFLPLSLLSQSVVQQLNWGIVHTSLSQFSHIVRSKIFTTRVNPGSFPSFPVWITVKVYSTIVLLSNISRRRRLTFQSSSSFFFPSTVHRRTFLTPPLVLFFLICNFIFASHPISFSLSLFPPLELSSSSSWKCWKFIKTRLLERERLPIDF